MIALKPFDLSDWQAFAGAEAFAPGRDPLIGETLVDGHLACVVLDRYGLSIMWEQPSTDEHGEPKPIDEAFDYVFEGAWAAYALAHLDAVVTSARLRELGGVPS